MSKPLNAQQIVFADEYMIDFHGEQAAIRAGYSAKTAKCAASRMLKDERMKQEILKRQKKISAKSEVTQEWVLKNLKSVAERCMQSEAIYDKDGNFEGIFKFEHAGANRSLELIGKHLGMFNDVNVKLTIEKELESMTDDELKQRIAELNAASAALSPSNGDEEA